MYKSTTTCESVNDLRRELFIEENKDLESIPPTSAALFQHALRASYIAGYVWHQSLIPQPVLPTIEEWGWKTTDSIPIPYRTDLPEEVQLSKSSSNVDAVHQLDALDAANASKVIYLALSSASAMVIAKEKNKDKNFKFVLFQH